MTRAASRQTDTIIRFLVDRDRVAGAYRAYAYFRWVDDRIDQGDGERPARLAFINRQRALLEGCYRGERPAGLTAEERLLVELVESDQEKNSGLQAYIGNMMKVMEFDARRRGRLISEAELVAYSRWLATAVTEALHYFIGHDGVTPQGETRYLAVTAAHITHMLRDTLEDVAAGYFNVPREFLESYGISPDDVDSAAYRAWVESRVRQARAYFKTGKEYLAQVESLRCRLAGYSYVARFERVLDGIEKGGYRLCLTR
ncbi:MAG: squalene/phytoene synthase family protein [Chloroflexi bacterium]|nr:squalene/phytoene synthase family protein [Chloroflexota bacterium]MCI0577193.1 squalene/phytoene synthase family protein [Chloroflexota bacterium]MCI0649097.1 squalene/phytoene synthase family protein [Chloroflexota bacterium]MCI0727001.1 squalene/phytoene synthase family protein [Chloroflexota bacterium]